MNSESVFPSYPAYKDSGIEWLGAVPEHWIISRLGFEAWTRARLGWKGLKADEYVDDGFVLLATPNIKGQIIDFENVNYINRMRYEESPEIKIRVGDVLLAKDGSTLGTVNVVRTLPRPATVNSSVAVITPSATLNGVYLFLLFQSAYLTNTIQSLKGGMGVPHLFQEDLVKFYVPLPTVSEQQAIAAFLDRETAKIDTLIEKQQRLIALLTEKRQAAISHVVTKGLDPKVPMKESGIKWLGKVPEYWKITKLKYCCKFLDHRRVPLSAEERGVRQGEFRYYGASGVIDFIDDYIFDGKLVLVAEDGANLLSRSTPLAFVADGKFWVNNHAHILKPDDGLPEFWAARIESINVSPYVSGSAQPKLTIEALANLNIVVPPVSERRAIAFQIKRETSRVDILIAKANKSIDLMKERRSALISAAVTGKIDVRQVA